MALDGNPKSEDQSLASSTLLADENNKDIFGLVISYSVKVMIQFNSTLQVYFSKGAELYNFGIVILAYFENVLCF